MSTYIGQHRMPMRWQRAARREARRATRPPITAQLWAVMVAVYDWSRIPWSNMGAAFARLTAPRKPVGGYQICLTCIHGEHAGCGLFDTDPPCGCHCYNATKGRHDHEVSAR